MPKLTILYQSDDNYAAFMGVSICSLLENNKSAEEISIYIIDDSISKNNKELLLEMVQAYSRELFFISGEVVLNDKEITDIFAYTGMRKNTHSYLKLFLDKIMPDCSGRVIYIDCDTAVTGNIQELITLDMGQKTIGMVKDSLITKSKISVGLEECDNYYNSGIIVVDMDKWRERRCSARILEHIKNIRIYGTVDQDVLNVELKDEIYTLPIKYNLQPLHMVYSVELYNKVYKHKATYYSGEEIEDAVDFPGIVHYLRYMGESPWNLNNVHPAASIFDKYLELSPWRGYQKKAKHLSFIFKVEKWMYKYLPSWCFLRIFNIVHERMIMKSNKV